MLRIDYTVKTDENVEIVTHRQPDNLAEIDRNIILIEGPGSTGKSTLLNMIAIGCYGTDDENLSKSTRSNLAELSNDYRDVKFDIQISDPTSDAFLRLQKEKGKELKVTESMEGHPISRREFRNKYKLIYDVPEDPTKRLTDTTRMIKNDNQEIRNKLNELLKIIADENGCLVNIPSEQEALVLADDLRSANLFLEDTQEQYDSLKITNKKCEILLCLYQLISYRNHIKELDDRIKEEEKKPASDSDRLTKIRDKWLKSYRILNLKDESRQILVNSRNEELISIAQKMEILWREANSYDIESSAAFLSEYKKLLEELDQILPKDNSDISNARLADDLIILLNEFDPEASLGKLGTVHQIKEYLENFKEGLDAIDYGPVRTNVSNLLSIVNSAERTLNDAWNVDEKEGMYRDSIKLESWENEWDQTNEKIRRIKEQLQDLDVYDMDHPQSMIQNLSREIFHKGPVDEDMIEKMHKEGIDAINDLDNKREIHKQAKNNAEIRLSKYEKAQTLPFFGKTKELQTIGDACASLCSSLNDIDRRLDRIDKQDKTEYNQHPELYDPIWAYVGSKLNTVRNRGVTYKVKSVNLLEGGKGVITTVDGRVIHIDSMGTGEGQQTYLKGLLSTDDSRKIIALFDEVGNMSGKILQGVIEDLEEKQKEGKLMLGIMVQPRDDEKVSTYGL